MAHALPYADAGGGKERLLRLVRIAGGLFAVTAAAQSVMIARRVNRLIQEPFSAETLRMQKMMHFI